VQPARIETLRKHLESRGARRIAFLHTRDRQVANSESFVSILKLAKGIFFPGGASRVLDETYHGTLVEREARALLKRGGVIAGDSARITIGCLAEVARQPAISPKSQRVFVCCRTHQSAARRGLVKEGRGDLQVPDLSPGHHQHQY
jgi:hypothetical protein